MSEVLRWHAFAEAGDDAMSHSVSLCQYWAATSLERVVIVVAAPPSWALSPLRNYALHCFLDADRISGPDDIPFRRLGLSVVSKSVFMTEVAELFCVRSSPRCLCV